MINNQKRFNDHVNDSYRFDNGSYLEIYRNMQEHDDHENLLVDANACSTPPPVGLVDDSTGYAQEVFGRCQV